MTVVNRLVFASANNHGVAGEGQTVRHRRVPSVHLAGGHPRRVRGELPRGAPQGFVVLVHEPRRVLDPGEGGEQQARRRQTVGRAVAGVQKRAARQTAVARQNAVAGAKRKGGVHQPAVRHGGGAGVGGVLQPSSASHAAAHGVRQRGGKRGGGGHRRGVRVRGGGGGRDAAHHAASRHHGVWRGGFVPHVVRVFVERKGVLTGHRRGGGLRRGAVARARPEHGEQPRMRRQDRVLSRLLRGGFERNVPAVVGVFFDWLVNRHGHMNDGRLRVRQGNGRGGRFRLGRRVDPDVSDDGFAPLGFSLRRDFDAAGPDARSRPRFVVRHASRALLERAAKAPQGTKRPQARPRGVEVRAAARPGVAHGREAGDAFRVRRQTRRRPLLPV
mmetsp:Transcript_12728/g.42267  ORF Transcript_12728/g.42267 Transcript_12728/m.42267 type:complete len:386 (+) Transcript_12728:1345-2502(+)